MQNKNGIIAIALIVSMAIGGVALGMEGSSDYPRESGKKSSEKEYVSQEKSTQKSEVEVKRKAIMTTFEESKKALINDIVAKQKYLEDTIKNLTEDEKKAQKTVFETKRQEIKDEYQKKSQEIITQMQSSLKNLETEYKVVKPTEKKLQTDDEKERPDSPVEKKKQQLKDKLSKIDGDKKHSSNEYAQCKEPLDLLRTAREANAKERKTARDSFWEANKGTKKDIFVSDSREDIKDTLDAMRLQISLVERKYIKTLVGTASVVSNTQTLDYALVTIDTIAKNTRTDLAGYVEEGKLPQFTTFRDGFMSVLMTNKKSFLALLATQAQTIKGLDVVCQKKASTLPKDQSDRQNKGQLHSAINTSFAGSDSTKDPKHGGDEIKVQK